MRICANACHSVSRRLLTMPIVIRGAGNACFAAILVKRYLKIVATATCASTVASVRTMYPKMSSKGSFIWRGSVLAV